MTGRQIPKIVHVQESAVLLTVADCKEVKGSRMSYWPDIGMFTS